MLIFISVCVLLLIMSILISGVRKEQIEEDIKELKIIKDRYSRSGNNADEYMQEHKGYVLMHQYSASYSGNKELIDFVNEILKKYYNAKHFVKLEKKKNYFVELFDTLRFIVFFIIVGFPVIILGYFLDCIKFLIKFVIRFVTFIIIKLTKLVRYVKI